MLQQEDKLVVCPYNPSHLILPKRLQTHLAKCQKNYPTQHFLICPMDATHHIHRDEYEEHLETCPSRAVVDTGLCEPKSEQTSVIPQPLSKATVQSLLPVSEESWDDICVPSYDPKASSASKNVIRTLTNAPPAQRKEFHRHERLRLLEMQQREIENGPSQKEHELKVFAEKDGPVRMPINISQTVTASQGKFKPN